MPVRMAEAAPELARAIEALFRVRRAARTKQQKADATVLTDRWVVLALQAGWTHQQVAEAAGVRSSAISDRLQRYRRGGSVMPPRSGVLAVPYAPLSPRVQARLSRQRLIGPAEVARLVGCQAASARYWAACRGVACERTPGGTRRLYDRLEILAAAKRRPTEKHHGWERRKNIGIPPQLRKGPDSPTTRPRTVD